MAEEQQVELDLDGAEETVVDTEQEAPETKKPAFGRGFFRRRTGRISKAESNTQKRIDRSLKR